MTSKPSVTSNKRGRFAPFLRTLPTSFPTVPLWWAIALKTTAELEAEFGLSPEMDHGLDKARGALGLIHGEGKSMKRWRGLLAALPESCKIREADVEKRFREDWNVVQDLWPTHLEGHPDEKDELKFGAFLLGWLNVNTRCVYYELYPNCKNHNNLTLAPVLDMINHDFDRETRPAQNSQDFLSLSAPAYGSRDPSLKEGDELAFTYGAHEDSMLLTEYGFTLSENPYNNLSVDGATVKLFNAASDGEYKRQVLEDTGYWGEMTFQLSPPPATPSWRVMIALRLLHLRLPRSTSAREDALLPFHLLLSGERETISYSNEEAVKQTIREIARSAVEEAEKGVQGCRALLKEGGGEGHEGWKACVGMVRGVWESEGRIARDVLDAHHEENREQ